MRRLALVFAAVVASCGGDSTTTVTPSTVPGGGGGTPQPQPQPQPVPPAPAPVPPPIAGPCSRTPQVVTMQPFATTPVAVDTARVYFAARDGSERGSTVRLWAAPINSGPATQVGTADGDADGLLVAVTDANVFLAENGAILRFAKDGSAHAQLASANAQCLQAAGGFVYWCDDGGVLRAPESGGMPTVVVPLKLPPPALAVDGDVVWVADDHAVARAPAAGGAAIDVAMEPEAWSVSRLAVDAEHVYFVTGRSGAIYVSDKSGSVAARTLYSRMGNAVDVGAADGFVYWLYHDGSGAHIGRVAADGTQAMTLADSSGVVAAITVAADALYFTESDTGRVFRVCK